MVGVVGVVKRTAGARGLSSEAQQCQNWHGRGGKEELRETQVNWGRKDP